jgi:cyclophilin family peptidyl-prolyl cis-trans isomerase
VNRNVSLETLENRLFMHTGPLKVNSVVADNRGEMLITLNQAIRASNVNTGAVQMYTGGPDGIVGNGDDTRVTTALNYQSSSNRIVIRSTLPAGTGYRIKLVSTRIETPDGDVHLDGEFNGSFPSGNGLSGGQGVSGGNFEFQTKNDKTSTPLLRMSTSAGVLTLRMRKDVAPKTVNNFFTYANSGVFDGMFFTRSVPGFVIQGGSLRIDGSNEVVEPTPNAAVVNEFNISNTRGTVAMAKQGGNANSATNQFFFNLADNSGNLDGQNGGFTVFAQVTNSAGLGVMDAIAALPTTDLSSQIGPFAATGITDVPVNNKAIADAGLDPNRDLVVVRRTAPLMRVVALG